MFVVASLIIFIFQFDRAHIRCKLHSNVVALLVCFMLRFISTAKLFDMVFPSRRL